MRTVTSRPTADGVRAGTAASRLKSRPQGAWVSSTKAVQVKGSSRRTEEHGHRVVAQKGRTGVMYGHGEIKGVRVDVKSSHKEVRGNSSTDGTGVRVKSSGVSEVSSMGVTPPAS